MPPPPSVSALSRPAREARLVELLGKVAALEKTVAEQREEIARLKGLTSRPAIKPSGMDQATEPVKPAEQAKRRFRGKVTPRVIIDDQVIKATAGPAGLRLQRPQALFLQGVVVLAPAAGHLRERRGTSDGPN